jgi:ribonucleoside-diphosphate reductase alpha chain
MLSSETPKYGEQTKSTTPLGIKQKTPFTKFVIKRNGSRVPVQFDKITRRITSLSKDLQIEPILITQKVIASMTQNDMFVGDIDELAASESVVMCLTHVDYATLGARILISNLHKMTPSCFTEAMEIIHAQSWAASYSKSSLNVVENSETTTINSNFFSEKFMATIRKHSKVLDAAIQHNADYLYSHFGIQTLCHSYLHQVNGKVVERPQYMLMRVAVWLNMDDIPTALETYKMFAQKLYTHASPTLFNAGKQNAQASSCFLLQIPEDSLDSIYSTLHQCANISKHAGGIGLSVHNIRASGSIIRSSGGKGSGLVPMLRVFNATGRYVNQSGKRKGAIAIYIEPWHADILSVIDMKKPRGAEETRATELHYAMWIPDLFMHRVENNLSWTLFCPDKAPGLSQVYGAEFNVLYEQYEAENREGIVISAREVWNKILISQIETGEPYILFKDHCNQKSNQKNLGTLTSSNLCAEILEFTSKEEVAVCNLASICLPQMIINIKFDFQRLYDVTYMTILNLNKVIDLNYYPVPEARTSNLRHRPIGVGVQGLADVFCMFMWPFDCDQARQLNLDIFETIYFAAMTASKDLAKICGPYETYSGSPVSQGIFQFDMWNVIPSTRWDWANLKAEVATFGIRNSLLVAMMPTASTAQIMGNNEGCEAYTSNIFLRRVSAGEFIVVNHHLANYLVKHNMWNKEITDKLIYYQGSIQNIKEIPENVRAVFRTSFELKCKPVIDMAADRGAFICQTQSMNLWIQYPNTQTLNAAHFYSWKKGLKTGMYYLRSMVLTPPQQFTIDPDISKAIKLESSSEELQQQQQQPTSIIQGDQGNQDTQHTQQTQHTQDNMKSKTFSRGGKTYTCTEDVCTSCGS